jgi:hypothetical protein
VMICSGVCRLLLIADLLAESPTSSDPNIRSGLLSGGHANIFAAQRFGTLSGLESPAQSP